MRRFSCTRRRWCYCNCLVISVIINHIWLAPHCLFISVKRRGIDNLCAHLNRPQHLRDWMMAMKPRRYFSLKAYRIGLMQLFDEPSHWAIGVNILRKSSVDCSNGPTTLDGTPNRKRKKRVRLSWKTVWLHFEAFCGLFFSSQNLIMVNAAYRGSHERTNRNTTKASIFTTFIFDCCWMRSFWASLVSPGMSRWDTCKCNV